MKGIKMGYLFVVVLVLALLVLGTMMGIRYQQDMQAHRADIAATGSQVIETGCGPVEYTQTGSGYPVLVIHGNGGGVDQGLLMASGYIDQGFQVIALSRFGYLRTPIPENATVEMQADAYACLLDALNIDQVAVFTSSAGVTSSVQFALRHPERVSALIFHSPNAPGEVGLVPPPQPVFKALLNSNFAYWALTTYLGPQMQSLVGVPEGFELTAEFQEDVDGALKGVLPVSERAGGMIFDTYVGNPTINSIPLEQVNVPTLVISAVDDPMALHTGARVLAERIPGAQLVAISDGGHLMLGHTDEVRTEVARFLRDVMMKVQAR